MQPPRPPRPVPSRERRACPACYPETVSDSFRSAESTPVVDPPVSIPQGVSVATAPAPATTPARADDEVQTGPMLAASSPVDAPGRDPTPLPRGLRVGGMAFGNGVLMRSRHHWAWARDDGSLSFGGCATATDRHRVLALPVVRSLIGAVEMVGFAVERHRENGRSNNRRLLAWLGVYAAIGFALELALPAVHAGALLDNVALQVAGLVLSLVVIWKGMGPDVWRFHGAEHKAVNAYERGADLRDTGEVLTHSRVHDRCGTNLVFIVLLLMLAYLPFLSNSLLSDVVGAFLVLPAVAVAFELFRLIARFPTAWASRLALGGGRLLQRCVTTREPSAEQQALACRALAKVIELEGAGQPVSAVATHA